MGRIYIVTGAGGHLGSAVLGQLALRADGAELRGLLLRGEPRPDLPGVRFYEGDVREPDTLEPMFKCAADDELYVIHAAGIVSIADSVTPVLHEVNVNGTRNVIKLCSAHGVRSMVYVSSVHALPDVPGVICEADSFAPDSLVGGYARTKAEASQLALNAAAEGLNVMVVHPSGILGPMYGEGNHMVQLVRDYLRGALPACVRGGYDIVDVRDAALGCILAAERGRRGRCYILSNQRITIAGLLEQVRAYAGGRRLPVLPLGVARAAVPIMGLYAKLRGQRPLFTRYSLYAVASNSNFSHERASVELGYAPRPISDTVRDTVDWLRRDAAARVDWSRWLP